MRRVPRIAMLATTATIAVMGLSVGAASAGTGSLQLIADNWYEGAASADGSRIAYVSEADDQVYVRDVATGVNTLVSTPNGTTKANDFVNIQGLRISRNGRFVAFQTYANNLDPRDTDGLADIYLKDLSTGALSLVSTTSAGVKGNLSSYGPAPVSDNGTVVFRSLAQNFPPVLPLPADCYPGESYCGDEEIYAKSLSGTLTLVSLGTRNDGEFSGAASSTKFADISADGTKVAIDTGDTMTPDDTDGGQPDVVVVDLTTGSRTLASDNTPGGFYVPSLSADGSRVAFQGAVARPLLSQVYVRDLAQSAPVLVSQNAAGEPANDVAQEAILSSDGRYLIYSTRATNIVPEDTDAVDDIILKDLTTGSLRLVTVRDDGTKPTTGNGSGAIQVFTGGTGVLFATQLRTFDPGNPSYDFGWYLKQLPPLSPPPPPPPADGNGDGILDSLQPTGTASGAFVDASTTPVTQGNIVSTGGLTVSIADATDAADGVLVTVGSGSATARATISACGVTLRLSPGSSAVITCGSVIVRTLSGSVQAVLDNGLIVVTIPAGSSARVSDTASGATVTQVVGPGVTATVNGQTASLAPGGAAVALASWSVSGFSAPVDNQPVLNTTKAGRAVPLKWHVTNASAAPVTTLTTATVTVQNLSCGLGVTTDELEETFAGGSGLQNLGNGDYQLNWKTPSTYAGSCKTMVLDLGGGVTVRADFRFAK